MLEYEKVPSSLWVIDEKVSSMQLFQSLIFVYIINIYIGIIH